VRSVRVPLWLPALVLFLVAAIVYAQGAPAGPSFFTWPVTFSEPITATSGAFSGALTAASGTFSGPVTVSGTSITQFACSGAGLCNMSSATGRDMNLDCGGGTCNTYVGVFNSTDVSVGPPGGYTFLNGEIHFDNATGIIGFPSVSGNLQTSSTTTPTLGCTGATQCNFTSASGQDAILDCGGGTCVAGVGTALATTTVIGRSGHTTNVNGNVAMNTGVMTCSDSTICGQVALVGGIKTVTVKSGCKPICSDESDQLAICSVASTTLTIQDVLGGTEHVTYLCLF
jgi:hypothetical protein